MIFSRRLVPVLQGITVTLLATAAVLLAWQVPMRVQPKAPTLPALIAQAPVVADSASVVADSIVEHNIFSFTREAPEGRTFAAAATDATESEVTAEEYGADAGLGDSTSSSASESEPVPALHGVVDGPLGRAALLRLDPTSIGSRLFHPGEGAAGYRVRSIGADRVELSGPDGLVVLELVAKRGTP